MICFFKTAIFKLIQACLHSGVLRIPGILAWQENNNKVLVVLLAALRILQQPALQSKRCGGLIKAEIGRLMVAVNGHALILKNFLRRYNLALTAFLFIWAAVLWLPGINLVSDCFSKYAGEAMFSGTRHDDLLWSMPLQLVLVSLLKFHLPYAVAEALVQVLMLCVIVLIFVVALQFGSSLTAVGVVLGLALFKQNFADVFSMDLEQLFYVLVILTIALALILREDDSSYRGMWIVAVLVGIAVLIRSPLFLFPLVLLAYDLTKKRIQAGVPAPGGNRLGLKRAHAVFLLLPFLMLLPRVWMIWSVYGKFSFLEVGRADNALVTGALGVVAAVDHGRALGGVGDGVPLLPWFIAEVASHPLRFLLGIGKRLYFFLGMVPIVYLAAAALWRFRKSEALRMPALLCAYMLAFYLLLCIEARYLIPVCALLLVMTAALPLTVRGPELPKPPAAYRSIGAWTLKVFFGGLLLFYIAVSILLLTYPARASKFTRAPYAVAEANPANAWLQEQVSLRAFSEGDMPLARRSGARALLLQPGTPNFLKHYLLILTLEGVNINHEVNKLKRSEATGILYESEESQFALPKLLNSCVYDPGNAKNVVSHLLAMEREKEAMHFEYSRLDGVALMDSKRINDGALAVLLCGIMGELPPEKKCFAARCLLEAVQQSEEIADLAPIQAYVGKICSQ